MFDVITMGSATVDVSANTHSQLVKFLSPGGEQDFIAYPSGSKILMHNLSFSVGGGGTNTAVSFSRLGLKTAFLGKIGGDENATQVLNVLSKEQVQFIGARGGQTGYSIILDSLEKDRTILTFKGSNNDLRSDEIDFNRVQGKWLYSSSMVETSYETMKQVMQHAKHHGMQVAFNPSNYQAKQGFAFLSDVIMLVDVLVLNAEEADLLFDRVNDPNFFTSFLEDHPEKYVVVTDGSNGVICYTAGREIPIYPTPGLSVVESTGAGDAFASGFIAGLAKNFSIDDALRLGMVQAESVIQCVGAKDGLLFFEEAHRRLKQFHGVVLESQDTSFNLVDGKKLRGLDELVEALPTMHEDVYYYHTSGEHHFSNWVRDVFGLVELAKYMKEKQTKEELYNLLVSYKRGEVSEN